MAFSDAADRTLFTLKAFVISNTFNTRTFQIPYTKRALTKLCIQTETRFFSAKAASNVKTIPKFLYKQKFLFRLEVTVRRTADVQRAFSFTF